MNRGERNPPSTLSTPGEAPGTLWDLSCAPAAAEHSATPGATLAGPSLCSSGATLQPRRGLIAEAKNSHAVSNTIDLLAFPQHL